MTDVVWRRRLGSFALLVVSLLLSLGAAEWVLRRYFPEGGVVLRLDPELHYGLKPRGRKLFRHTPPNGGGRVLVTVNSRGFRGDELTKRPGRRIVVYGDSSIFAAFSPLEATFTVRLEARLRAALGPGLEVVNAGVEGYGPCQTLLRLERELAVLHPDVVVFAVFADNDFGDLVRNKLFALDADGRLVAGEGVLAPEVLRSFADAEERTPIHLFRGIRRVLRGRTRASLAREEELPARLGRQIDKSVELCRLEFEEMSSPLVTRLFEDHYDADVAFWPDGRAARYKRALLRGVLLRLAETTRRAHVPVVVLVIPSPIDVCESYDIQVDGARFPEYRPRRLSEEAAAAAGGAGLATVELYDAFREAGADRLYYRAGEDHWNAAGEDLAAERLAAWLIGSRWLGGAGPGSGLTRFGRPTRAEGSRAGVGP